ncbi:MAG: glycosyltransferase [Flavobacteriales bacterium]|nr:glycosyltransferase [Flavobacteriales bacterium]
MGPSDDDTHAIVERMAHAHPQVRLVENPAGVVPHGLNAAIRVARGDHIVRMDAHSRYPRDYAVTLVEALDRLGAENVGGISVTLPMNDSDKAWAIAQVLMSPFGVGNARYRIGVQQEQDVDTVPFGCFRRDLFDRIGYFDEELVRNQDDELNGRIKRAGGRIVLLPSVRLQYFGRDRIGKLWRMYRDYGLFKPLVNLKLGRPATVRQFAPPLFVLGIALLAVASLFTTGALWMLLASLALYIGILGVVGLRLVLRARRFTALPWVVVAFMALHFGYGMGYWTGTWRFLVLRQRVRPERVRPNR